MCNSNLSAAIRWNVVRQRWQCLLGFRSVPRPTSSPDSLSWPFSSSSIVRLPTWWQLSQFFPTLHLQSAQNLETAKACRAVEFKKQCYHSTQHRCWLHVSQFCRRRTALSVQVRSSWGFRFETSWSGKVQSTMKGMPSTNSQEPKQVVMLHSCCPICPMLSGACLQEEGVHRLWTKTVAGFAEGPTGNMTPGSSTPSAYAVCHIFQERHSTSKFSAERPSILHAIAAQLADGGMDRWALRAPTAVCMSALYLLCLLVPELHVLLGHGQPMSLFAAAARRGRRRRGRRCRWQ